MPVTFVMTFAMTSGRTLRTWPAGTTPTRDDARQERLLSACEPQPPCRP